MADFSSFQPIVQASQQKNQAEQQQAVSQMLQFGHLMLYKDKQDDLDKDRQFKAYNLVLGNEALPEDVRIKAGNQLLDLVGLKGTQMTVDGLRPFASAFKKAQDLHAQKGDAAWEEIGPMLTMLYDHPTLVTRAQTPELQQMVQSMTNYRAGQLLERVNGPGQDVLDAKKAIANRKDDLLAMRGQKEAWMMTAQGKVQDPDTQQWVYPQAGQSVLGTGPDANAKANAQESLDRLQQLEIADALDQSKVQADTHRKALNDQVRQYVVSNPKAMEELLHRGLVAAGILDTNDNMVKADLHRLMSIPADQRTDEQNRMLDVNQTYLTGKTANGMKAGAAVQLYTEMQQRNKAESQGIDYVRQTDAQTQDQVEQFRTLGATITEKAKSGTLTEDEYKAVQQEAAGYSSVLSEAQGQALASGKATADWFTKDRDRLVDEVSDMRKRLGLTPAAQREDLKRQIGLKEDLIKAREAQAALLTTHNPMAVLDQEWMATMARQEADHLKTAMAKEGLDPQEKERLTQEAAAAENNAAALEKRVKTWSGDRNGYLGNLRTAQTGLDNDARILQQKLTAQQRLQGKEDANGGLIQAMITDMANTKGLSITDAYKQNAKDWPGHNAADAQKAVSAFFKDDYDKALGIGQVYLNAFVAKHPRDTELLPQDLSRYTNKAVEAAYKETGIRVKPDDVVKAYQKTENVNRVVTPIRNKSDAIETHQAVVVGKKFIRDMTSQIQKVPTAVGPIGRIHQFVAGWSQNFAAMMPDIDTNGQSLYKYISSKPQDELEAMHGVLVYSVARALSPVGVISDQDAERAANVVGDLRGWNVGFEQVLNKLQMVDKFLDLKDDEANRVYHNQDPWAPTGGPHAKDQPAAEGEGEKSGLSPEAEEFFKKHPNLRPKEKS